MPVSLEEKTVRYKVQEGDTVTFGVTNPDTMHFYEHRYVVLRDFIPKEVMTLALDVWKTIEAQPQNYTGGMKREGDIIDQSPEDTLGKSVGGHSSPMGVAMGRWMKDALEKRLDLSLRETYTYSRKYDRGAFLKAHVDRASCEVSTTYCLDYQSDDRTPWKIWVQNDENYLSWPCMNDVYERSQALPPVRRVAKPLTLYPGDVLVYQGPNVIHFRDKFNGDYSYHMFSHFHNLTGGLHSFCKNRGISYTKGTGNAPDPAKTISALEYDGRPNRYVESGTDDNTSQLLQKFEEEWCKLPREEQLLMCNFFPVERVEE